MVNSISTTTNYTAARTLPLSRKKRNLDQVQEVALKKFKSQAELNQKLRDAINKKDVMKCTDWLLQLADPNTQTRGGMTALVLAARMQDAALMRLCLEKGASSQVKSKRFSCDHDPFLFSRYYDFPDDVVVDLIKAHPIILDPAGLSRFTKIHNFYYASGAALRDRIKEHVFSVLKKEFPDFIVCPLLSCCNNAVIFLEIVPLLVSYYKSSKNVTLDMFVLQEVHFVLREKILGSLNAVPEHFNFATSLLFFPESVSIASVLDDADGYNLFKKCCLLLVEKEFPSMVETLRVEYMRLKEKDEKWMEDPEGYALFLFTVLMSANYDKIPAKRLTKLTQSIVASLGTEDFPAFHSQLFHHPLWAERYLRKMCVLHNIVTSDKGYACNSWEEFIRDFLSHLNMKEGESDFSAIYATRFGSHLEEETVSREGSWLKELSSNGWKELRWQGRTLIFKREDGRCLAIKWLKIDEEVSELLREYEVVKLLNQSKEKLSLKSEFPTPIGVFSFTGDVPGQFYDSPTVTVAASLLMRPKIAYVYECRDESYFIYPQDPRLTSLEFSVSRQISHHDLGKLASEGVFMTALADLFHNKEKGYHSRRDGGRFLPLSGLIRDEYMGYGNGCISAFRKAVEFPNMGLSGLRDVGDSETIARLDSLEHKLTSNSFSSLYKNDSRIHSSYTSTVLKANFLAEYMLVDELLVGERAKIEDHLDWRDQHKFTKTANLLKSGPISLFSGYTGIPEKSVADFIEHNGVDWEQYARQAAFWMQNNEEGYIPFVKRRTLPEGLYDKDVRAVIQSPLREMTEEIGFTMDKVNPDLGTGNGPYPITEGVKDRYITTAYMLLMREVKRRVKKIERWYSLAMNENEKTGYLRQMLHLNPHLQGCNALLNQYRLNSPHKLELNLM